MSTKHGTPLTAPFGRLGSRLAGGLVVCLCLVAAGGCGKTPPPQFSANLVAAYSQDVSPEHQAQITDLLTAMFGTPDKPFVMSETELDIHRLRMAAGPVGSDQFGKSRGLYRQHCVHCHGTTGRGDGPTASVLNPYPRDYTRAEYKFKGTFLSAMPTDADLERVIRAGVAGTAMPSFDLLPRAEVEALVEYVKYLTMRGQTETAMLRYAVDEVDLDKPFPEDRATVIDELLGSVTSRWSDLDERAVEQESTPRPTGGPELAASIKAGEALFYGAKGNCVKCHGPSGQGDGMTTDYDLRNKYFHELSVRVVEDRDSISKNRQEILSPEVDPSAEELTDEEKEELAEERKEELESLDQEAKNLANLAAALDLQALPVRTIRPRNLRLGIYRGGRRPVDLFRRMYTGINGTPMPGVGPPTPGQPGTLTDAEIWNVVDYVRSLPYQALSRPTPQQQMPGGDRPK